LAYPRKYVSPPRGAIIFNDLPRTPKGTRLWTCSGCRFTGVWRDGWLTYGSYAQQDDGYCERVYCPACSGKKLLETRVFVAVDG
jgi:hypothetical protein